MTLLRIILTHAAATCGAFLAAHFHVPLAFIIGPLVTVGVLGFAGAPVRTHRHVRDGAIVVVMTAIGLAFTPAAAAASIALLPVMLIGAAATVLIGCFAARTLARTSGIDRTTAFFASIPGGPVEMSLIGERHGARPAEIAMSQLLRIVGLVLIIPPALTFAGFEGSVFTTPGGEVPFDWRGLSEMLAVSLVVALVLRRLGVQTGFLLGPMCVGALFAVTGHTLSSIPMPLMNACQILMGTYLGSQFKRDTLYAMRRFLPLAIVNVLLLTAGCAITGILLAYFWQQPVPSMILATAPGSVTEMAITAKVLHYDVSTVTAAHLLRIFLVLATIPYLFAGLKRLGFFRPDPPPSQPAE